MKTFFKLLIIFMFLQLSCTKETEDTTSGCYHGYIIGKIRSWGGGVAISMTESDFSKQTWNNHKNVVEALNIPDSLWVSGKEIYFDARFATESEKIFFVSADGDESNKPIIYILNYSFTECP